MENASKALIIAGAILLSILIIGLGMFVYQQAANALGRINLTEQQVQTVNAKFENYGSEGSTITGTQAKALCDTVMSYNRTTAEDASQYVTVTSTDTKTVTTTVNANTVLSDGSSGVNDLIQTVKNGLGNGKTYTLHFGYEPSSSLIVNINLEF